jgi:LmbE family N-acetylglucosaminyl deacetylase
VRVLAVGAHPDDLEILCGGTLTRFVREGHAVTMCHATRGDRGSYTGTREEVARKREAEARTAAEIAGADSVSLGLSDGEIDAGDPRQRRLVIDLVRDTRPDVIITHAPTDYMSDHNEISKLVFDCSFHATLPLLETERPHHDTVTPIYLMDTLMGLDFVPTEYVDITETIDTKAAMLEAHASQLRWLREHDGVDIVENMKTVAAYRGLQCSVKYAEAFRPYLRWLRATTRRYLPA